MKSFKETNIYVNYIRRNQWYHKLISYLPYFFGLAYSKEVLQLFVNEEGVKTFIGICNFPSFFGSELAKERKCVISIRNQFGNLVSKKEVMLEKFGSRGLDLNELFGDDIKKIPYGIVSVKLKVDFKVKGILDKTQSHFYSFFKDDIGSVALVHPQSRLYDKNLAYMERHSRSFIDTNLIKRVSVFHINPSSRSFTSDIFLISKRTGEKLFPTTNIMKPFSVVKTIFDTSNLLKEDIFLAATPVMQNSMPITFRYFEDNTFTMSHS